jgi:hypothetical protein
MAGMQLLVVDVDEELDELDELDEDDEATGFLPLVRFLGCLSSLLLFFSCLTNSFLVSVTSTVSLHKRLADKSSTRVLGVVQVTCLLSCYTTYCFDFRLLIDFSLHVCPQLTRN